MDATKKDEPMVTKSGITKDALIREVYQTYNVNPHLDLSSYLSGVMAVMSEVFPTEGPGRATRAIPKIWYFGDEKRIREHMAEVLSKA